MPFINDITKQVKLNNNQSLTLNPEYLKIVKLKKITGSRLGALMGADSFKTPFQVWCEMTGLYKEISDDFMTKAGAYIEDKIFNYVSQQKAKEGMKWASFDATERNFDEFDGSVPGFAKNEVFGGLLDGVPQNDHTPVLEIKTCAKNKWKWKFDPSLGDGMFVEKDNKGFPVVKIVNGGYTKWFNAKNQITPPKTYAFQLGLYCYLTKNDKGMFAVSFLNDKDYVDPQNFVPNKDNTIILEATKFDLKQFEEQVIKPLTEWYNDHIKSATSPTMTPKDVAWFSKAIGYDNYNKLLKPQEHVQKPLTNQKVKLR